MTSSAFLLSALFLSTPTPTDTVKLNLIVGDKFSYRTTSVFESDGMGNLMKTTTKSTEVIEVLTDSGGWYRLRSKVTEFEAKVEGDDQHTPADFSQKGLTVSYEVSASRKIRKYKIEDIGALVGDQMAAMEETMNSDKDAALQELSLPDGEVTIGTSWETKNKPPTFSSSGGDSSSTGEIKTTFKVTEFTGKGKDRAVVIEAVKRGSYSLSFGGGSEIDGSVVGTSKYWVRLADGMLINLESQSEDKMAGSMGDFSSKHKRTIELVKA